MMRFILTLLLFVCPITWGSEIPIAIDLQDSYSQKGFDHLGNQKVVLLLISQPNCEYCVQVTEEILKPMQLNQQYKNSTLFSRLEIYSGHQVKDFNGQRVDATEFAQRYNAWATPTLLFLDGLGNEVAEKIVGVNTLDLYGFYVDRAVSKGHKKLNAH
ncbi:MULTISPECIES: thioredoxin fold domain-containing protein [unclassified Neptuniibacter]|uniref:thioredoxin family protein n=1 Tax=unclassified Neptuniibacter TaxID=2630693 RepID=UPI000C65AC20|nr:MULTISPECIES: thioredoxin fold domain-containing protein [unclassified Neptuniibacter]MAY41326.1 hypothetical protein [Oceanospirillaceae bacterium]|tara:strand:+ start:24788 stop:25261 length:474 start_codon:yes stop_codon:yes gene_type:complete